MLAPRPLEAGGTTNNHMASSPPPPALLHLDLKGAPREDIELGECLGILEEAETRVFHLVLARRHSTNLRRDLVFHGFDRSLSIQRQLQHLPRQLPLRLVGVIRHLNLE